MRVGFILVLVAMVSMLACARSQNTPASEGTKPSVCDQDSGKWDPYHINCDFDCDADGWEIKCKCDKKNDKCDEIECKVDRDGAPDDEDVFFNCKSNGDGKSPTCALDSIQGDLTPCVTEKITTVLNSWIIGVSD